MGKQRPPLFLASKYARACCCISTASERSLGRKLALRFDWNGRPKQVDSTLEKSSCQRMGSEWKQQQVTSLSIRVFHLQSHRKQTQPVSASPEHKNKRLNCAMTFSAINSKHLNNTHWIVVRIKTKNNTHTPKKTKKNPVFRLKQTKTWHPLFRGYIFAPTWCQEALFRTGEASCSSSWYFFFSSSGISKKCTLAKAHEKS